MAPNSKKKKKKGIKKILKVQNQSRSHQFVKTAGTRLRLPKSFQIVLTVSTNEKPLLEDLYKIANLGRVLAARIVSVSGRNNEINSWGRKANLGPSLWVGGGGGGRGGGLRVFLLLGDATSVALVARFAALRHRESGTALVLVGERL